MKYELIITRTQPSCGGKPPMRHEFRSVTTDDPVAYVRQSEDGPGPDVPLDVSDDGRGTVTVAWDSGAQRVTFEFTED